jgi:ribosomal protein S18 acetylase RimI-like enzyme
MNLRRAFPNDAPAIGGVHVDSWRSAYRGLVPDDRLARLDSGYMAERFTETIVSGSEGIYVAEESDSTVGFMALGRCRDADVDQNTTGEMIALYLLPEYWRKGIGRAMCREGEEILRSQGYSRVALWVFEGNTQGRRFYEALGFAPDGALKAWGGLNACRYTKDL